MTSVENAINPVQVARPSPPSTADEAGKDDSNECEWPEDGPICYGCLTDQVGSLRDALVELRVTAQAYIKFESIGNGARLQTAILKADAALDRARGAVEK